MILTADALARHKAEFARIDEERRDLQRRHRSTAALRDAERAPITDVSALLNLVAAVSTPGFGELLAADEALYRAQKVHHDAIRAHRDAIRQAKVNDAERAATYAAACTTCFTVHAGDCM